MPNSVQKKLSNMFSRVGLADKGNSSSKLSSKGVSKRFSLGSPLAKENGGQMGGGDQDAMLSFIEQQGNQISQLKEHIASLEAKLLASPPGYCVKPAALMFSPIRGAQSLSEVKSPKQCISVPQAAFVPQGSGRSLNVITSPVRDLHAPAAVTNASPMAQVHVMHFSQLSLDSTFSTANGSALEAKDAIPFQEFVDSCLVDNVKSPSARPLLASFVCGDTSALQEQGHPADVCQTQVHEVREDIDSNIATTSMPLLEHNGGIAEWSYRVVAFSSQQYWIHSVTRSIELAAPVAPGVAEQMIILDCGPSVDDNDGARTVSVSNDAPESAATCTATQNDGNANVVEREDIAIQLKQHDQEACCACETHSSGALDHIQGNHPRNLLSPCAVQIFLGSPNLDAAAANHAQSKVSPGFSVVSPIMQAANSNQASGNESAEYANHIVINGLVFSGMAKLPEYSLQRIRHSRAEFQIVEGVAWVPDCVVDGCMLCDGEFSMFFRRHHCRTCGIVICSRCSEWNKDKRCCTSCVSALQTPSRTKRMTAEGARDRHA